MDKHDEYFQRTLRLRQIISGDEGLRYSLRSSFDAVYGRLISHAREIAIPDGLDNLGFGQNHIIIGLRKSIPDRESISLPLAVRFNWKDPYDLENSVYELKKEAAAFEQAFAEERNPPYFICVVTANTSVGRLQKRIGALILEDLSNGKTINLYEDEEDKEIYLRTLPEGTQERRFLDPSWSVRDLPDGFRSYCTPEARIDL